MNKDDTYTTIAEKSEGLYKDKGSKFIALAYPVETEEKIKDILPEVKKKYHDARHHCYAYMLGIDKTVYRINDDGEPSGTAGKPIFGQILAAGITNVLIVVVRYFGGTKLGVRGLINAYRGAAQEALSQASIITRLEKTCYQIRFDYISMNEVMKIIKDYELETREHQYDTRCSIILCVRNTLKELVIKAFHPIENIDICPI